METDAERREKHLVYLLENYAVHSIPEDWDFYICSACGQTGKNLRSNVKHTGWCPVGIELL